MNINQIFLKIFDKDSFQDARSHLYSTSHPFYNFFATEIPRSLMAIVDNISQKPIGVIQALYNKQNEFSFIGSIGKGKLADIFWFGIMDRKITVDPQTGVYVVYLVSYDGESIYLALIQGVNGAIQNATEYDETIYRLKNNHNVIMEKIKRRLSQAPENYAENFTEGAIDLSINDKKTFFTAKAYQEAALFSKKYNCDDVLSEDILRNDLRNMLKIYNNYRLALIQR